MRGASSRPCFECVELEHPRRYPRMLCMVVEESVRTLRGNASYENGRRTSGICLPQGASLCWASLWSPAKARSTLRCSPGPLHNLRLLQVDGIRNEKRRFNCDADTQGPFSDWPTTRPGGFHKARAFFVPNPRELPNQLRFKGWDCRRNIAWYVIALTNAWPTRLVGVAIFWILPMAKPKPSQALGWESIHLPVRSRAGYWGSTP
jgi:hypothetical protein